MNPSSSNSFTSSSYAVFRPQQQAKSPTQNTDRLRKSYSDHLRANFKKTPNNLPKALLDTIALYVKLNSKRDPHFLDPKNDEVIKAIDAFTDYLDAAQWNHLETGQFVLSYRFKVAMPSDFMEIITTARELERECLKRKYTQNACNTNTEITLISQCETRLAVTKWSPTTLFEETAFLEHVLRKQVVSDFERSQIEEKITDWIEQLKQNISEKMMEVGSAEELEKWIVSAFDDELIQSTFKLAEMKSEAISQIEFLNWKKFFRPECSTATMVDKYDFALDFLSELKKSRAKMHEVEQTLAYLLDAIERQAYQVVKRQKIKLMDQANITVNQVFSSLKSWCTEEGLSAFKKAQVFDFPQGTKSISVFKSSRLFEQLQRELAAEKALFENWEKVYYQTAPDMRSIGVYGEPFMQELDAMRYTWPLDQDPKALLTKGTSQARKPLVFRSFPAFESGSFSPLHQALPLQPLAEANHAPLYVPSQSPDEPVGPEVGGSDSDKENQPFVLQRPNSKGLKLKIK